MQTTELIQLLGTALLPPMLVGVACLYAWAGLRYAIFRFPQRETEDRLKRFLRVHFPSSPYPPRRRFLAGPPRVTSAILRRYGLIGWNMVPMPLLVLSVGHLAWWSLLVANVLLFFGGSIFAFSWYSRRCLRLLGFDAVSAQEVAGKVGDSPRALRLKPQRLSWTVLLSRRVDLRRRQLGQWFWSHFSAWAGQ